MKELLTYIYFLILTAFNLPHFWIMLKKKKIQYFWEIYLTDYIDLYFEI